MIIIQYRIENHALCPLLKSHDVITGLINITVNPVKANTIRMMKTCAADLTRHLLWSLSIQVESDIQEWVFNAGLIDPVSYKNIGIPRLTIIPIR